MPRFRRTLVARPLGGLQVLDVLELAAQPLLLDALKPDAQDWELVEDGDDTTDGYKWADPTKCTGGLSWDVHTGSAYFNQKPTPQDIAALYATIEFPDKPSETCDAPCLAVSIGRYKRYRIFKNKTTGQFWLFCSKRVQWECQRVEA